MLSKISQRQIPYDFNRTWDCKKNKYIIKQTKHKETHKCSEETDAGGWGWVKSQGGGGPDAPLRSGRPWGAEARRGERGP